MSISHLYAIHILEVQTNTIIFTSMSNVVTARSPGRINIIGEHTDYNMGYVLPAAIDKYIDIEVSSNGTVDTVSFTSQKIEEAFTYNHLSEAHKAFGWQNYLVGVVEELKKLGLKIEGFDAIIKSNIPIGSGISSSAALECSLAFALNTLFDLSIEEIDLIKVCQRAEHKYVGTKCGIMDQYASMMGKKEMAILLDCATLEAKYYPILLGDYELLLLNTNVTHNLATAGYNQRREECEYALKVIQAEDHNIASLSDCDLQALQNFQPILPATVYKRCHHVISENDRVLKACSALKAGKLHELGKYMYASHHSLREDYAVSCPELDFLVELSKDKTQILGSRMMGGGFGGCTLNLIHKDYREEYIALASTAYRKQYQMNLTPYTVKIVDGTHLINN